MVGAASFAGTLNQALHLTRRARKPSGVHRSRAAGQVSLVVRPLNHAMKSFIRNLSAHG